MRKLLLIMLFSLALGVNISKAGTPAKWTFMLYLLEDGTDLDGVKDFNEFEVNGSIEGVVNYVVLWNAQNDANDGVWLVQKDNNTGTINSKKLACSSFGKDFDMSNYKTLEKFILWVKNNYPAEHYGISMWDHGSGIFKKSAIKKQNKSIDGFCDEMKLWEMKKALKTFQDSTNKKIDIVGFDVCLLGHIETAYELGNYTDYVIASEQTEPGGGWDYSAAFKTLNAANGNLSPDSLAKCIAKTYIQSYLSGGSEGADAATQAVTSTKGLYQYLIPALNKFSDKLYATCYDYKSIIKSARSSTWYSDEESDNIDLGDFCRNIKNSSSLPLEVRNYADTVITNIKKAVIYSGYTSQAATSPKVPTGLKIWFPEDYTQNSNHVYYSDTINYLTFSKASWDDFLGMYENPQSLVPTLSLGTVDVLGSKSKGLYVVAGDTCLVKIPVSANKYKFQNITAKLSVEKAGYFKFIVDSASKQNIGSQQCDTLKFKVVVSDTIKRGLSSNFNIKLSAIVDGVSYNNTYSFTLLTKGEILVINKSGISAYNTTLLSMFTSNGLTIEQTTAMSTDYSEFKYIFLTLGISGKYKLTQTDWNALQTFLKNGGRLYLEGGDAWYSTTSGSLIQTYANVFGISCTNTGSTLTSSQSLVGSSASFAQNMNFSYSTSTTYNKSIDVLTPQQNATAVFSTSDGNVRMVQFANDGYKTVGSSILFLGLKDGTGDNVRSNLLKKIFSFLMDKGQVPVSVNPDKESNIKSFELMQNYPNPFNPSTNISYNIPQDGLVKLKIFDMLGREIVTLVDEKQTTGLYTKIFNASSLASGVYLCKISFKSADNKLNTTKVSKMLLMK